MLPAHAGMIPRRLPWRQYRIRAPRSRGDDPARRRQFIRAAAVLPAHAGMIPITHNFPLFGNGAPRSRGDDPGRAPEPHNHS